MAGDNVVGATEVSSTISGTNDSGALLALTIGGRVVTPTVTGTTWSYTLTPADITNMGQGTETLSVTQTDAAGNTSPAGTLDITVATEKPIAPVINTIAGNDALNGAELTAGTVITGTNVGGATVALTLDGQAPSGAVTVTGTTWSYTLTAADVAAMGQGAGKALVATQTDAAGNISDPTTRPISIDTLTPTGLTITAPVAGDNLINAAEAASTTLAGKAEAGATVNITLGGTTVTATADASGNWQYPLSAADIAAMGQGAETISVTQTLSLIHI